MEFLEHWCPIMGCNLIARFFREYCGNLKISNRNSSPAYPQSNGQAEVTNKTIINNLKKRLKGAKGNWVEKLPNVIWAY